MQSHDPGYSLAAYAAMLMDDERARAYITAMEQSIRPGDLVIEIGAGPGIFSMLAARMGARKVIAVECNPSIRLARRLVQHNNLVNKVVCIEGLSTDLQLAERANVIISDLRSVLPLYSHHIPSIVDARERLLVEGGTLIGFRDRLFAAPVEHAEEHQRLTRPWLVNDFGLDLSAGFAFEVNRWSKVNLRPEQLLADGQQWLVLDYSHASDPTASARLEWEIERSGKIHGIALWFDAELAPGIGFSNRPRERSLIYGQAFLPLPRGVSAEPGSKIFAEIHAHWVNKQYVWHWKGSVVDAAGSTLEKFDQSTVGRRLMIPGN